MRAWSGTAALGLALRLGWTVAALGGQARPSDDFSTALPAPADRGRPMIHVPPDIDAPSATGSGATRCLPALPCGTHLYGAVQRNGAVAIEVPALRW